MLCSLLLLFILASTPIPRGLPSSFALRVARSPRSCPRFSDEAPGARLSGSVRLGVRCRPSQTGSGGGHFLRATRPRLVNAGWTRRGHSTSLAAGVPTWRGESDAWCPGRNRKTRPPRGPACRSRREGRGLRGRRPAAGRQAGRWAGGRGRPREPLTTPSLNLHLRRTVAGGAMDLAGLLDEEGTFSLTGFQDFTVSAQPPAYPNARA